MRAEIEHPRLLGVIEQRHKSEIHMQLLMTMEQGPAGVVGHKVDFYFLVSTHHDDIIHDAGRLLFGDADQFKAMAMQMHRVDVRAADLASDDQAAPTHPATCQTSLADSTEG